MMKSVRELTYIISFFIFRPLVYLLPFGFYLKLVKILSSLAVPVYYQRRQMAKKNLLLMRSFTKGQVQTVLHEGIKNVSLFGLWTGWWRMDLFKDERGEEVFHIHSI